MRPTLQNQKLLILRSIDSGLDSILDKLQSAGYAEFLENVALVRVYGTHGDIQLSGYLFRCQTLAAEFHYFKLSARHLRNVFHRLDVIDDFLQLFRLGVVRNRWNERKQLVLHFLVLGEDFRLAASDPEHTVAQCKQDAQQ